MPNSSLKNYVSAESLERKHEVSEKRLRNVLLVGGGAWFLLIASLVAAALAIHWLSDSRRMQRMDTLGLVSAPDLKPLARFPEPNLQVDDDHAQRLALEAAQRSQLNSYGWVDRTNGVLHIPIERAMALILRRGLPTRTNGISQTDGSPLQLIQDTAKRQ